MECDYASIRNRLQELKERAKLDNYEFCKIYAPDKCTSKDNAENYMSAVFSGRRYPTSASRHMIPEIEYLNNIVNSELFPDVTLNYLVYGDETPAKTIEKLDLNPEHWKLADFCEFIGRLKKVYPYSIKGERITVDEPYTLEGQEELATNSYYSLKFLEYDGFSDSGHELGGAVRACFTEYEKMNHIPSEAAKDVLFEKIIEAIHSDARFDHPLYFPGPANVDTFVEWEDYGQEFKGLSLE